MSRMQALSLAALLAVAAGIGGLWGLRAIPPGETAIIDAAAASYVAETGGAETDCAARPSALEGVRLVVVCEGGGDDPWIMAYDASGRPVAVDPDILDAEPTT